MSESKTQNFLELLKKIREAYHNLPIIIKAIVHDDADHPVYETHVLMSDSEVYPRHIMPYSLYLCPVVSYEMRTLADFKPIFNLLGVQPSSDVLAVVTLDATGDTPVRSPLTQNEAEEEIRSAYEHMTERSTDHEEYWQGYIDAAFGLMGIDIDFDGNVKTSILSPLKQMELTIEEEDRIRELDLNWDAFRAGMTFAERHGKEEAE
mgnify:CR=1 FL=1